MQAGDFFRIILWTSSHNVVYSPHLLLTLQRPVACPPAAGCSFLHEGGAIIKKHDHDKEMWQNLALYGFLSVNLGLMTAGGFFIGRLIERNYHTKNMTISGVLIGIFLGFYEMFMIAYKVGQKK